MRSPRNTRQRFDEFVIWVSSLIFASIVLFQSSFKLKRLHIPDCGMGVAQSRGEGELLSEGYGPFEEHTERLCFVFPPS